MAYIFTAGDHLHDSRATQHYMLALYDHNSKSSNVHGEVFHSHWFHSDNAGQHFKNKHSIRFLLSTHCTRAGIQSGHSDAQDMVRAHGMALKQS